MKDFIYRLQNLIEWVVDRLLSVWDYRDDIHYYLRKLFSRALYKLPKKRSGKRRLIYLRETLHLWLFPVLFLYDEILLRILSGTGVFRSLIYPIVFGLAYGLLLNIPTTLFNKKTNRHLTIFLMAVINILYIVECVIHRSYFVYMTIGALLTGAKGVATGYSSEMFAAIFGNIFPMLLFLLPVILYAVLGRRFLPTFRYKLRFGLMNLALGAVFLGLGILMASTGKTADQYGAQYAFDSAVTVFGLPTGLRLSLTRGSNGSSTFVTTSVTGEVEKETETESLAVGDTEDSTELVDNSTGYNEMDLDLEKIASESTDSNVVSLTEYIETLEPSNRNAYTGLFEGKNIIVICAEAFTDAVISEERTPTLYRMQHNGFYFTEYYQPAWGGSTSTGEYSYLFGLVPGQTIECMQQTQYNNNYFTIGNCMQRLGYANGAFHNGGYSYYDRENTHPNLGYGQWIAKYNGIEQICGLEWPKDTDLLVDLTTLYCDEQPFSLYFMTVNGHSPYTMADWYLPDEYLQHVIDTADREYAENTLCYLGQEYSLEVGVTNLIALLEEKGIADDTVIVITGDHYPYGLEDSAAWGNDENYVLDLYGVDSIDNPWDRDHNALIIWSGCLENEEKEYACTIDEPTYSLDILPTLLNLFNIEYDSRLLAGRDVFSDTDPLVLWNTGSWITDKGRYNADTYTFTPADGEEVSEEYIESIKNIVTNKISMSNTILSTNYYGILFGDDTCTSDNRTEDLFTAADRLGTNVKDLDSSEDTGSDGSGQ